MRTFTCTKLNRESIDLEIKFQSSKFKLCKRKNKCVCKESLPLIIRFTQCLFIRKNHFAFPSCLSLFLDFVLFFLFFYVVKEHCAMYCSTFFVLFLFSRYSSHSLLPFWNLDLEIEYKIDGVRAREPQRIKKVEQYRACVSLSFGLSIFWLFKGLYSTISSNNNLTILPLRYTIS